MILYQKSQQLRLRRADAPLAPFWFATAVAPYGSKRTSPLSIDLLDLRATATERAEVSVSEVIERELTRGTRIRGPVLVEATGPAEAIFRKGAEALAICNGEQLETVLLTSVPDAIPSVCKYAGVVVTAHGPDATALFADAAERAAEWGVFVPIVYPATTRLPFLEAVASAAADAGATFLASASIELDPAAKQVLATEDLDDDEYETLFHADLEAIHLATERHLASLAAERGMLDYFPPPGREKRTNWNGSALLALTAARMIGLGRDAELAAMIQRSSRAVAELEKPIERVAEAASLSIVESIDEVSVDILTEWLESGTSAFAESVAEEWRLRRDYYG